MATTTNGRRAAGTAQTWISRLARRAGIVLIGFAVVFLLVTATAQRTQAQTFTVLHTFGGMLAGDAGFDGEDPNGGLIIDKAGNLYGTTGSGGANSSGTVFKLDLFGNETVLYNFQGTVGDGVNPAAGLIMDSAGNLYGTTEFGGANGYGTVFKLDASGNETVLYSFKNIGGDGTHPLASLIMDVVGNLYGTTFDGGTQGTGTVFKLDTSGNETVLHDFGSVSGDGLNPDGGLIMDAAGNLYGATARGGGASFCSLIPGCGTVFRLDKSGNETVLHNFPGNPDGINPYGSLVMDSAANLYGTTEFGGANGAGTVFKLDASGIETVLYSFTSPASGGIGALPPGGLLMDAEGNSYGTTVYGGSSPSVPYGCPFGCGTVFRLDKSGNETVLHNFEQFPDGYGPLGGLVMDAAGNLYGATGNGGGTPTDVGAGTVFKIALAPVSLPLPQIGPSGTTTNPQATVAEPISTGNGNYFYQHTDFDMPGRGMPIIFRRSYNSLDNYSGPLGANWTDSYNIVLTQPASNLVSIKWGDGHGETFTLSGGVYVPQPGVYGTLVKNGDGSFLLTRKDQTMYLFTAAGKLASTTGKNGNAVSLTYDGSGNLIRITNAGGRSLALTYDASNRIARITDPLGRTVLFSYDGNDNLVTATDPLNQTTSLTYDAAHRVTSVTLPDGDVLLENTYDSQGRVISQTNGRNFTWTFAYGTPNSTDTTITDPKGNKTIHTYDGQLRIIKITDAAGGTLSYTYDGNNDRMSVTNQDGKTTQFAYDGSGNITRITDALGNTTVFTYDAKNDLLTATNPKGKTTNFSYNPNGNLLTIKDTLGNTTGFTYDSAGELTSKTDTDGHTTTYGYDSSGDLTRVTDTLGDATNLSYDGIGRLASITDPNGHTAQASYDGLSRLTAVTDPLNDTTQFKYDVIGNLTKLTDADGNITRYAYDATNNLVAVTDAMGHVTQYGYDADNNRVSFENADDNATAYGYDALNRLVTITDPLSLVTGYAYDPAGNVVAVTDADGKTNHFAYDALNRLVGISYADGTNIKYDYDADGNRVSMTDPHGTTAHAYDALDRLVTVTYPGNASVAYSYDAVGNRSSLTYPNDNAVHYSYDAANRLSNLTDWFGRVTSYAYDQASNLLSENYPNGAAVSFAYDAANRLVRLQNSYRGSTGNPISDFTYVLDPVGNRLQVTDGSGVTTRYGYNPLYELTSVTRDTKVTSYTYDPVGNRLTLTTPGTSINDSYDADDRLLSAGNFMYTYDADGNRISETNSIGTVTYAYNSANQLTSVSGAGESGTFAYDGDGNRISQSIGVETYTYLNDVGTALPVVLQESGPDGDITYAYGHGLVSESSPNYSYFYQYDGLGTVVGLTEPNGMLAGRYTYDAWGNAVLAIPDNHVGTINKLRFTGEALDPGTGLYFLRARYYDPGVGRFLNRDPLAGLIRMPQTTNRYVYAMSNPVSNIDPSGQISFTGVAEFFVNLWQLIPSAEKAYDANQQVSQQCGYTGTGNLENCTPQLQQNAQTAQKQAIQQVGEFAASQPSTIYGGIPVVSDLIWLWNQTKDLFTIPVANAQAPASPPPPANSSAVPTLNMNNPFVTNPPTIFTTSPSSFSK